MIKLGHKAIVTDPCYSLDTWCTYIVNNVLPGEYKTSVKLVDGGSWGKRVGELSAIHSEYTNTPLQWGFVSDNIGVDSGQCGIYDFNYRLAKGNNVHDSLFYKKACKCTDGEDHFGEQEDSGVTSCSGYGDGSYDLYLTKNGDDDVVGIKIVFIEDEESQNDED